MLFIQESPWLWFHETTLHFLSQDLREQGKLTKIVSTGEGKTEQPSQKKQ